MAARKKASKAKRKKAARPRKSGRKKAARKKTNGKPVRRVTLEMPSATMSLAGKGKRESSIHTTQCSRSERSARPCAWMRRRMVAARAVRYAKVP